MANLRDLGLSEYEARAYRALLQSGPTTAKELSRASDVPMGRIYDVLTSLEQYNLVRSQSASRPKKYVAVEPATALDRLLEDKKRELDARAQQYEEIVDDLVGELDAAEPVEETFWTAAVGPEETVDLLIERLSAADAQIVMVFSSYTKEFFDMDAVGTLVVDELSKALDRGAEVKLLMRPEIVPELPESIGRRYRETLAEHDGFDVRTSENVSGTFTLIDRNEVVIEVPHPLKSEAVFGMIDLKDLEFAESVRGEFDPRWADADPLSLDL
ncbi:TrmB family transcriptional regulator [Natronomonas sp. EA1]|uniref:TrmB family transcriptional regulator n=1 Tax=Natronomonas sp. EA1 TaxID=3421655 RepID=UPI003EB7ED1F